MLFRPEYSPSLRNSAIALRERIMSDPVGVYDQPTQHHQLSDNRIHGRKLDFDLIVKGSDYYDQWMETYAQWINEVYGAQKPDVLLGIANGTNRVAASLASKVGATSLETVKVGTSTVALSEASRLAIQTTHPEFILLTEDAGTTGGTTSTVIPELYELGVGRVEVAHTWIRSMSLEKLDQMDIRYSGVIHEPLPTFNEDDCMNLSEGYCYNEVELIPHGL